MLCWSCNRENLSNARFCAACGVRLGCAACGAPRRSGQRVCAACGLRCNETDHFRLHYAPGSFAEASIAAIGGRMEGARATIDDLLKIDLDRIVIDVYVLETVADPRQPDVSLAEAYAVPRRMEIHAVYRPDNTGNGLESALLRLLIALIVEDSRPRPALIVDGLLAAVLQRTGLFPSEEQVSAALADLKANGTIPPVVSLMNGPEPEGQGVYNAVAASFGAFLLRIYGAAPIKDFLRRLGDQEPDAAARAALGRRLTAVQAGWMKTLPGGARGRIWWVVKLALGYLRPYPFKVAEILLYTTIAVGFSVLIAKMQGLLLDKALIPSDRQVLLILMAILAGAFVVTQLTGLRQVYLTAQVLGNVTADMMRRLFTSVQYLHIGYFQRMNSGDVITRFTSDLGMMEGVLGGAILKGYSILLTLVLALVLIILEDWRLAIVALVGMPLFLLISRVFGPPTQRAVLERQQEFAALVGTLHENLSALPVVKAFGLQQRMIAGFSQRVSGLLRAAIRMHVLSSLFGVSSGAITYAITLTVFGVGGWLVTGGDLSIGSLFTFIALMGMLIAPLQSVTGIFETLNRAAPSLVRVQELLDAETAIDDRSDSRTADRLSREIRVENVSFSYTGQQVVVQNLSLAIPAGKRVALVGPSGCGKSTFLSLLLRFFDPQQGRITLDGVDLRDLTLDSLRGQIGIVLQESFLFNISIRENIRLGNLDATDAEIEAAARAAEIHEVIESLSEGYDTVVGERGGQLSGGQRQRVAIARAIVRNPSILLLDEATSALDPATEAAINQALERVGRGRTTLFVTHRLSSVVTADLIYVMNQGVLVEHGTHHQLLEQRGLYAYLWEQQGGATVFQSPALPEGDVLEAGALSTTLPHGDLQEVRHGG